MMGIEVGKTYLARNQGRAITPVSEEVTVVWLSDKDVHYRVSGSWEVRQTTLDRFKEIVRED